MRARRHGLLAAVSVAALAGALIAGVGGADPSAPRAAPRLAPTPAELVERCERLAGRKRTTVLCPQRLAASGPGGTVRPGPPLCRPSRTYLLEYRLASHDGGFVGRVLVGGAARSFLLQRAGGIPVVLRVPDGAQILGRARVHDRPAVVLRAPPGGIHGGHVLVLWNEDGHGYLASVGGNAASRDLARAALGIAEGMRPAPAHPAEAETPRLIAGEHLGRSARGRTIRGSRFGIPRASSRIAVFGCIHGDECAGIRLVRELLAGCPGGDYDLLAVPNLNPDGRALGTRLNGRGVDLNRNFSSRWRRIGRRGDPEHSGPRPFSEPETRLAAELIEDFRPDVTIWFHQHRGEPLVRAWGASVPLARRYARFAGVPFRALPWLAGTAPNWQNHRFPGTASFVVELPFGAVARGERIRHVQAIMRLAAERRLP